MIYFHQRFDRTGVVFYATYGQDHLCAIEKAGQDRWNITVPTRNPSGKVIGERVFHPVHGDLEKAFKWVQDSHQELHKLLEKPKPASKRSKKAAEKD